MSLSVSTTHHPRGIGKIISLICAGCSLTCSFFALGLAFWFWMSHGITHVYTASLFATTFFFFTAAIVLHAMSRPQPRLPQGSEADEVPSH